MKSFNEWPKWVKTILSFLVFLLLFIILDWLNVWSGIKHFLFPGKTE